MFPSSSPIGTVTPASPPGAGSARLKAPPSVPGPAIAAHLIIEEAHQADLEPLGQKARRAPIEMQVDAALILGGRIDEVVRQPGHRRKFIPRLLVEIGVAGTGVQRAMSDAHIRKPRPVVGADRNIT